MVGVEIHLCFLSMRVILTLFEDVNSLLLRWCILVWLRDAVALLYLYLVINAAHPTACAPFSGALWCPGSCGIWRRIHDHVPWAQAAQHGGPRQALSNLSLSLSLLHTLLVFLSLPAFVRYPHSVLVPCHYNQGELERGSYTHARTGREKAARAH